MAMVPPRSPLAPAKMPDLPPIAGVTLASTASGIKKSGVTDLLLAVMAPGTSLAGVLTRSLCPSAPVDWCRACLANGEATGGAKAIVVNSGNANAFTGRAGASAARRTAVAAAEQIGCKPEDVMLASTGVIGEQLPDERITAALPGLVAGQSGEAWPEAAEAIRTTDTFAKAATASAEIGGVTVTINGIAKGSGMIAPDMATMLGFLFTDAAIPAPVLSALLTELTDRTFNAITVDSDTSTSDTVLLAATGQAGNPPPQSPGSPALAGFRQALESVMRDLAQQIVRDGEGASKFIQIAVTGADSAASARRVALAIANSPLVKTAIAGEDPNWGRVVMAVGKAGERADRDRLTIGIGGIAIARDGERVEGYDEGPVAAHMKGSEIEIDVDLGIGDGSATVWTCDLTHGYISINADYRS